jgi:hypothetical protein
VLATLPRSFSAPLGYAAPCPPVSCPRTNRRSALWHRSTPMDLLRRSLPWHSAAAPDSLDCCFVGPAVRRGVHDPQRSVVVPVARPSHVACWRIDHGEDGEQSICVHRHMCRSLRGIRAIESDRESHLAEERNI